MIFRLAYQEILRTIIYINKGYACKHHLKKKKSQLIYLLDSKRSIINWKIPSISRAIKLEYSQFSIFIFIKKTYKIWFFFLEWKKKKKREDDLLVIIIIIIIYTLAGNCNSVYEKCLLFLSPKPKKHKNLITPFLFLSIYEDRDWDNQIEIEIQSSLSVISSIINEGLKVS